MLVYYSRYILCIITDRYIISKRNILGNMLAEMTNKTLKLECALFKTATVKII